MIAGDTQIDAHVPRRVAEDVTPLVAMLTRVRAVARRGLLVQTLGLIVAVALAAALAVGGLDYLVRMPALVRVALWAIGVSALVVALRRWALPAWRFRPNLTQIALRLESAGASGGKDLSGRVASGLELARDDADESSPELRALAARRAVEAVAGVNAARAVINPRRTRRVLGLLLVAGAPLLAVSIGAPALVRIGAARVLAPWADASWPKRTEILDATGLVAHPTGSTLPLRAVLTRTEHGVGRTEVRVQYRVFVDGHAGTPRRALLTSQGSRGVRQSSGVSPTGEVFERLLEPAVLSAEGLGLVRTRGAGPKFELEYAFSTDDDETPPRRIALVDPPAVLAAGAVIDPPAYARAAIDDKSVFVRGDRDLGTGADERAIVTPVLSGSTVSLRLRLNKPIAAPVGLEHLSPPLSSDAAAAVASVLPGLDPATVTVAALGGDEWSIHFTLGASQRVSVKPSDEYGLLPADEATYRFEAVDDKPATAAIIVPAQDESVLSTAAVPTTGEGRDDVGLASLALRLQPASPPGDSVGAAPEARGDPSVIAELPALVGDARPPAAAKVDAVVEIETLKLKPGDELWLTAVAADAYELRGATHPPTVSPVRKLKIITESELVEQVRAELSGVREAAIRLEQEQSRLDASRGQAVEKPDEAAQQRARQANITDRVAPIADIVRRLAARVEKNRLDDRQLAGVLEDADATVRNAAEASKRAETGLSTLAKTASSDPARPDTAERLASDQQDVDDALTQLASMLDRGQDSWAVRRSLEKLLTEQKQVASQTGTAGDETRGKPAEDLTQAQKDDLERLARRQAELAQRSGAAVEAMEKRAAQMKNSDAGQARAMQQAAEQARREQLEQNQRDASEQIRQNQTGQAQAMQQKATASLQRMLDQLDKTEQERDDALRRMLAEIIDSIRGLVLRQGEELAALTRGVSDNALAGLDRGMIRLNRDTLAVVDRVHEEVKQARKLTELLGAAGDAQESAITALRLASPDAGAADPAERTSLQRLNEALAEAQRLEDEAQARDNDRKRAELLKEYREALELQTALKGETDPLIGHDLSRRDRAAARALGARQETIRSSMAELKDKTKEIAEASLFEFAHARMERAMSGAARPLSEGSVPPGVARDQASALTTLKGLVEALKDAEKKKDDFRDADSGGGGGGGGGSPPLIPPIAELKLLRAMQAEAADSTRAAEGDDPSLTDAAALQADLAARGKQLLEKMQRRERAPAPEGGTGGGQVQ